jgi:hypothetical protein
MRRANPSWAAEPQKKINYAMPSRSNLPNITGYTNIIPPVSFKVLWHIAVIQP